MKLFARLAPIIILLGLCFSAPARADRPSFPMQSNAYRPLLQQRIDAVWAVIERKLDGHSVSVDRKKQIRAMLDDSAKEVWAEFAKAAADGTISREEADHLRNTARGLRAKVRSKMAAERRGERADKKRSAPAAHSSAAQNRATSAPSTTRAPSPPPKARPTPGAAPTASNKAAARPVPSPPTTAPSKGASKHPRPSGSHHAAPPHHPDTGRKTAPAKGHADTSEGSTTVQRPPGSDESGE